jgi:hypothetical protein
LPVANTGSDIAAILKYFSQTLLDILKEITTKDDNPGETNNNSSNNLESSANLGKNSSSSKQSGADKTESSAKPALNLANLAESATSLGTIVSKTVYSLNDDLNDLRSYSSKAKKYPHLNFATLYHSLLNIIEIIPNIQTSQIGNFSRKKT